MAIANTRVFGKHLDRDVNDIFFDGYTTHRTEFDKIVNPVSAPAGNHYTEAELSNLGALREVPEGDAIVFDTPEEGHEKTIYYTEYGLGFAITKHMYKDDLTGNFKRMPSKLSKSAANKRETVFFDLFNNGFATHTAWDGEYIFSTSHETMKSGTSQSNRPAVDAALSETSLQAAFEYADDVVDEAGMPLDMEPWLLVVPTDLRWTATRLWKQEYNIGSGNRDLLTTNPANPFVNGYQIHISRYLTSTTAWFMLYRDHDFRYYWKENATLESADDFYTGSALFKVTMRFACFVMDYKGCYGTTGA